MVIHNVMEDIIYKEVNKLFDEALSTNEKWLTCDCMQCRLDTMCFVLNRVKPRYIKSGKGFAHFLTDGSIDNKQLMVDISALVIEGMHKVLATQRPHGDSESSESDGEYFFNFPAISGKIQNGNNFNNMSGVEVILKMNDEIVPQMNILWDNPYLISDKTPGTFIFCPKPLKALKLNEERRFAFSINAEKEGFESVNFSFEIKIISENEKKVRLNASNCYEVKDIFLFNNEVVQ